ncbi:ATP-binding protein, partial [Streptomyces sp. NPDC058394]|uniref:ATP-binding protein n=1 Tax=Streptomyces sp. NPDC058394 TaxID=3346477 RepID=UPI00365EC893
EIQDTDARPPVPTSFIDSEEENSAAEHGRGLDIVGHLSSAWGTSPHGRGKTVWIDLEFNDAE